MRTLAHTDKNTQADKIFTLDEINKNYIEMILKQRNCGLPAMLPIDLKNLRVGETIYYGLSYIHIYNVHIVKQTKITEIESKGRVFGIIKTDSGLKFTTGALGLSVRDKNHPEIYIIFSTEQIALVS